MSAGTTQSRAPGKMAATGTRFWVRNEKPEPVETTTCPWRGRLPKPHSWLGKSSLAFVAAAVVAAGACGTEADAAAGVVAVVEAAGTVVAAEAGIRGSGRCSFAAEA